MEYEVTKDIYPFTSKGKTWIKKDERVNEISRDGNVSIVEYKKQLYPVHIQYLREVKKEVPVEKTEELKPAMIKQNISIPVKRPKKAASVKQSNLF